MAQKIATTNTAREKYAKAYLGQISLSEIDEIGFGNDGLDTGGEPKDIDPSWTTVPGELLRKPLETKSLDTFTVEMLGVLETTELNGEDISSAGLYDLNGDLLAVATFDPIPKSDVDKIEMNWNTLF